MPVRGQLGRFQERPDSQVGVPVVRVVGQVVEVVVVQLIPAIGTDGEPPGLGVMSGRSPQRLGQHLAVRRRDRGQRAGHRTYRRLIWPALAANGPPPGPCSRTWMSPERGSSATAARKSALLASSRARTVAAS